MTYKMRLIVMGQQAFGKDVLAKLLEAGRDEVVAVYCEPDRAAKPVDPIKEFALEQGLPVHQPANFNDPETLKTLAATEADLMVMSILIKKEMSFLVHMVQVSQYLMVKILKKYLKVKN